MFFNTNFKEQVIKKIDGLRIFDGLYLREY